MNKKPFSPIIAGTMSWGVWKKNLNTNQMIELMNCCLENEITTFDHADIYGGYTTEASFGKALSESNIERSKIQLISKCGIQLESEQRGNTVKHYSYSKEFIIWSVEQSLRNLETDYLDLLLLHRPSPLMQADEIAEAAERLKKDGKILDFGVSNFTPSQSDLIGSKTKISYNQIQFSVTHLEAMLDGSLDYMQIKNIKPMAWSPMGSVFKSYNEQTQRVYKKGTDLSIKYGVPVDVIILAWILKHPAGILPVIGTTDPIRISNLMKATTFELELQDWFELWTESAGERVP
ncbi:MAG: aldo/keto reductase family oxidoreductase [Chitinophagales bacterium]|jgi:predicted oxidoreductase|nr:aldo/keto reductase [Sphingobacteriales bacterium]